MMIKFKLDGKEYACPTSWKDVTAEQFIKLKEWNGIDFVMLLSIITGVPYVTMFQTKTIDIDEKLSPFIEFLKTPIDKAEKTSSLLIDGKQYPFPKDLTEYTLGQKLDAQTAIKQCVDVDKDLTNCMIKVTAIYMQPIVQECDYDTKKAEQFERVISKCSALEVFNMSMFFFVKLNALLKQKPKRWWGILPRKKSRPELIN
jgi:hypothetical protein